MIDEHGRNISYLRLSVTDLCPLRCVYCMPAAGVEKLEQGEIITAEECVELCRACVHLGIDKIRITGGEPLIRRGIVDICRGIGEIEGIRELCLTTNGLLLPRYARDLAEAGVNRVNISLDTLDAEKYRRITRVGELGGCLAGLEAAEKYFENTKINCVLMGGINDGEIPALVGLTREHPVDLRFIELMPIGECAGWERSRFVAGDTVLAAVPELAPCGSSGVARMYRVPGWAGRVGLISPMSHSFCAGCSRIRVTADGKIKPCLHSAEEIPLRGLHGAALCRAIERAIRAKPVSHAMGGTGRSGSRRGMSRIGG